MFKIAYTVALSWISACCFNFAYSYNYTLLEAGVETLTSRISRQVSSPNTLVERYLDFLNVEDIPLAKEYIKKQTFYNVYL
jgi:hypothetical protein